jgi:hypothetical protein
MSSFFSQSSHWYIPAADGTITPAHDFGLREARKAKAFPSVTTVLKAKANPFLETWKQNQIFEAVVKNPAAIGEDPDAYKDRIDIIASSKGKAAAEFGTRLHDALDNYPQLPLESDLQDYVLKFGPEYDKVVKSRIASEIMLVDMDIGVAGRTDLVADTFEYGPVIIDYKTSKFKKGKPNFYSSYICQLAFYAKAYQKMNNLSEPPMIANLGINSETPEAPVWKFYTRAEQEQGYAEFLATAFLWFAEKNYWPVSNWKPWVMHAQINGKVHSA